MSSIGITPLTGANPGLGRDPASVRPTPPEPATVQSAAAQPLTTPQSAVNQSPNASNANPDGQQQNPQPGTTYGREQLSKALDQLNRNLQSYDTNLQFDIDDQYQTMVVRIVDRETKEVVRQIPPEKALAVAQYFKELEAEQRRSTPKTGSTDGKDSSRSKTEGLGLLLEAIA